MTRDPLPYCEIHQTHHLIADCAAADMQQIDGLGRPATLEQVRTAPTDPLRQALAVAVYVALGVGFITWFIWAAGQVAGWRR